MIGGDPDALDAANGKLTEAKFFADLARADAHGARSLGDALMSGRAEAQVGAQFTGAAAVTESGAAATMAAAAGARARASGRIDAGPFAVHGRGEGMAGAEARAVAAARPQELDLKAGAFAGAKGKIGAGGDVGGIGFAATAEGWVGVGAEVDANIGKGDDGKYGVEVGAGAAVIPGGKLGIELSIDPGKVEQTYHETADAVADIGAALDRSWDAGHGRISRVLDDAF